RLLGTLAGLGRPLMPMGTSVLEEKLAAAAGIDLAVPDETTFERVNGKTYSRRITAELGLRMVPGANCSTVDELTATLSGYPLTGGQRVVVKDAFGVSGIGLLVIDSRAKAEGLIRLCKRRAERSGDRRLDVVVEEWLPKRFDLNYQLTITRTGEVTLDFVKQAITHDGVHKGHLIPAELDPDQLKEVHHAAQAVGVRLFADGYHGVAGIDAIVGEDGTVYPVLEINARLNMASYQGGLTERFQPPGHVAMARHYSLRLSRALTFDEVYPKLPGGVIPTCFGTVNAAADGPVPFEGRLHTLLVAPHRAALDALDAETELALAALTEDR
ncbi:MAG TPA: ATP-grasp domain-containing protein, partial [Amycolatopsis sp.]|nr:ATP-grasp domain-containing protein [Amycolatopsis sp.]